jgi:protein-disulfide isomerase
MDSGRTKQLINDNIEEANALAITGIPFFYINNQEIMGETTYDELERIVKIELNKKIVSEI